MTLTAMTDVLIFQSRHWLSCITCILFLYWLTFLSYRTLCLNDY